MFTPDSVGGQERQILALGDGQDLVAERGGLRRIILREDQNAVTLCSGVDGFEAGAVAGEVSSLGREQLILVGFAKPVPSNTTYGVADSEGMSTAEIDGVTARQTSTAEFI